MKKDFNPFANTLYFPRDWHVPDVDTRIAVHEMYETGSISKLLVKAYPDSREDYRGIHKKYKKYGDI